MIAQHFTNLAAGIEDQLRAAPEAASARKQLALEIARLGVRLFSGETPVVWCGVLAPFDLLAPLGVASCFVEFFGAMLASTGGAQPALEAAERAGYSADACGYHRAVIGATLSGMLPRPACLVGTSAPCSGGLAALDNLARHYGSPLFVIDVPERDDAAATAYVADQLRAMQRFVAASCGRERDADALAEAIARSNRARELLLEVYQLARAVPSPARRRDLINFSLVVSLLLGSEPAERVARAYRDELAAKVRDGVAGVPGERARLLWLQNRIQFRSPVEDLLADEHRVAIVADELNAVTWEPIDPRDPYTGLARRMLSIPLSGPVQRRVQHLQRMARDYRVDGAVNPCHWGCRQGTGARGLIERGLAELDVPVLNLEVDCIDERNFAPGQLRTRIDAFLEMIAERRAARAGGGSRP